MNKLSKMIKALKNKYGYNQDQISEKTGIAKARIRNLEAGRLQALKNNEFEMFITLGVSANWLLTGEGEMFVDENNIENSKPTAISYDLILTIMINVDEWLDENDYKMKPRKKAELIKEILQIYEGKEDKINEKDIKEFAIPFALRLVS